MQGSAAILGDIYGRLLGRTGIREWAALHVSRPSPSAALVGDPAPLTERVLGIAGRGSGKGRCRRRVPEPSGVLRRLFLRRYPGHVADAPKVITAEELDAMSPDQRAQVVREHIVTDLAHLPEAFRQRVESTASRLAEQLRPVTE